VKERDEALRVAMQKPLVVDDNARLEELAAAAQALEPLVWGLKKAAAFFTVQGNDGDEEHLQSLQLVQRGIERLVDDIGRAARGQPSAPPSSRELEPAEIDGLDFDLL
jgi:hypothetical protein